MNTTAANQPYRMIGIRPVAGRCAHCGRECPERVFVVEDRATGEQLTLGAHCSWKATGVRHPEPEPADDTNAVGETPDWMLGL